MRPLHKSGENQQPHWELRDHAYPATILRGTEGMEIRKQLSPILFITLKDTVPWRQKATQKTRENPLALERTGERERNMTIQSRVLDVPSWKQFLTTRCQGLPVKYENSSSLSLFPDSCSTNKKVFPQCFSRGVLSNTVASGHKWLLSTWNMTSPNWDVLPMQEMQVQFLGREDPREKEMATHCSILAWKIPRTKESSGLQSMGSQRVGHDWATEHAGMYYKTHSGFQFSHWLMSLIFILITCWNDSMYYIVS